jgi:pyrimidine-nucleoside phosphorylase
VGNANEIRESIETLRGDGPEDLSTLIITFGEAMLGLGGVDGGRERVVDAIGSGAALGKFRDLVEAQGGDPEIVDDPDLLPQADHRDDVRAAAEGFVTKCDARTIGVAATRLGAGRERKDQDVDHAVGVTVHSKIGDRVSRGDSLATVAYNDSSRWEAQRERLASAWEISDEAVQAPQLVIERIP